MPFQSPALWYPQPCIASYNCCKSHTIFYLAAPACRAAFLALFAAACLADAQPAIATAVVVWGAVVALSRCLMGRHFMGDILAGLLVGVATTAVVTQVCYTEPSFWAAIPCSSGH